MSHYSITLRQEQREELEQLVKTGKASARSILHAQVMLKADASSHGPKWSDRQIEAACGVSYRTILRIRQRFAASGMKAALHRQKQPLRPAQRKLDGEQEAQVIAMLCQEKPEGREQWTMRLLAKRIVELEIVERISHETVRQTLKKNELKPWQKRIWCIAPKENARFVAAMEDVLTVYKRPYHPRYPQVCLDEGSKQLVSSKQATLPMQPGKPRREDYEYEREGFCNVFVACEPLVGKRVLAVRPRRTARDWAELVRELIEVHYPHAEKIVLVMDNLNTHATASLYETFPKEKAWELSQKLEIHYTPVHGRWLNMAEIELSVLARQVLQERMASVPEVQEAVAQWQDKRNQMQATIQWHFTTQDARIKLQHLYPKMTNEV